MIDYYSWQDTETGAYLPQADELAGRLSPAMDTDKLYQVIYHYTEEFGQRATLHSMSRQEEQAVYQLLGEAKRIFASESSRQAYDKELANHYQARQAQSSTQTQAKVAVRTEEAPVQGPKKWRYLYLVLALILCLALLLVFNIHLIVVVIFILLALALSLYFLNS